MNILAIETSCDDTCVAVLNAKNSRFRILSNIISSQVKLHSKYGGVFPSLAKREHIKNLPIVLKKALLKAGNPKIDFLAVTDGPGLEPCLWTGINFAKDLAKKMNLPLVPVNHIEAHILANHLNPKFYFPLISLVVSGGHTQLVLMKNFGDYKILGETRDDAAGECFDKAARILGLGYPGGPIVSKLAKLAGKKKNFSIKLPRPMINQKNYDFSFSGLKTAVLYDFKIRPKKVQKSEEYKKEMAKEVQQAVIDVLIYKTIKAAKNCKAKSIILGGGVAANEELRKQFKAMIKKEKMKVHFSVPSKVFCTDNAAMIAITAFLNWRKEKKAKYKDIEADANKRLK